MARIVFKGFASTPDLDHYRHIVRAGAFDAAIKARGLGGPKGVKLLWQHQNQIAGRITALTTDGRGRLVLEGFVSDETSWGRDAMGAIKTNDGLSLSIGAYLQDADIIDLPDGTVALAITRMDLTEVSIVVEPGQPNAVITEWKEVA